MSWRFGLLVALLSASALAKGSVTDEVALGTAQSGATNVGSLVESLNGSLDLSDEWSVSLGGQLAVQGGTPKQANYDFATTQNNVVGINGGVDLTPGDHWSFGINGSFQPNASLQASADFTAPNTKGVTTNGAALLNVQSLAAGGTVDASYDTAGESDLEWSFGFGFAFLHQEFTQTAEAARLEETPNQTLTAAQLTAICARSGARCVPQIMAALDGKMNNLDSERVSPSVTATIWQDTDLRVGLDLYHYEQDPADILFVRNASYGPVAPLQWMVRPEITHRFGDLSLRLFMTAGAYEAGTGADNTASVGARAQYKFTKEFRMWITAIGQRDTYDQSTPTTAAAVNGGALTPSKSGTLALGAGYRW
jgi:hypothetical protein